MKKYKIYKREDGARVIVETHFDLSYDKPIWLINVLYCAKGKRKFHYVSDLHPIAYGISRNEHIKSRQELNMKYVTKEEVLQCKLELWENLKPKEEDE